MPEKYQDEIEEILRRSGESAPVKSPGERQQPPEDDPETYGSLRDIKQSNRLSARWWPLFSPGKVMLGGLIIGSFGSTLTLSVSYVGTKFR